MTLPPFGWKNAPNTTTPLSAAELEAFGAAIASYFESGQSAFGSPSSVVTASSQSSPIVFLDSFGTVDPAGVTDSTTALNAAGASGKVVLFRPGVYLANNLTLGANTVWQALGGGGASTDVSNAVLIKKNANGPLITLNGGAQKIIDVSLEGNGATYTGDNLVLPTGQSLDFEWRYGSNLNAAGYCANFNGATSSGRERFLGGIWFNYNQTLPAFHFPSAETGSTDKLLQGIFCSGGQLADFNGCQTVMCVGCDCSNFVMGSGSKKITMVGCRIATAGAATTILGINHTIVGNTHAGYFVINSTSGFSLIGPNTCVQASQNNDPTTTLIDSFGGTLAAYDKAEGLPGYVTPRCPGAFGTISPTANTAYLNRLVPSAAITITKIALNVTTAATANDNIDVGIYNSAGTLLTSVGSTASVVNALGVRTVTLTPITLQPGQVYYIAFAYGTIGAAVATLSAIDINRANNGALLGSGGANVPYLAPVAASFPLPASIVLTALNASTQPLLAARSN